jgi:hypothetical protein
MFIFEEKEHGRKTYTHIGNEEDLIQSGYALYDKFVS